MTDFNNGLMLDHVAAAIPPVSLAPPSVIKSAHDDQEIMLADIAKLHCGGVFDADITYGNGCFYKSGVAPEPLIKFDIDPQSDAVACADSTSIPIADGTLNSVVFDPPFLTYVRAGRSGNGNMAMAKRYSGYWRYDELEDHYLKTINETSRVLKKGGVMVFKCQDIIHNHKMHATHMMIVDHAKAAGMRLLDLFVLVAKRRMPSPNRKGTQRHSRIFHSYFLVLKKL